MTRASGYLLDTNVVSEAVRETPNRAVTQWIASQDPQTLFLSVVTIGELVHGATRLAAGARRERISRWVTLDLPQQFAGRVLEFGEPHAIAWGQLRAATEAQGRPRGAIDLQIAAAAHVANLTLVTRNVRDFLELELTLLDPW